MNNKFLKEGCIDVCRGCAHKTITLEDSIAQKENWLKNKLNKWLSAFQNLKHVQESASWHYRGKVTLTACYTGNLWEIGMIIKETKQVLPVPSCPVHTQNVNKAIQHLTPHIPPYGVFPLKFWVHSGKQLCLVLKTNQKPCCKWITEELKNALKEMDIEGLWLHLNPSTGKKIFAKKEWILLWGKSFSKDVDHALYGPAAFHQLIPSLHKQSLQITSDFFNICKNDLLIDLYCGIGKSLMHWSKFDPYMAAVESNGEAVKFAMLNAPQAKIFHGNCEQRLPQLNNFIKSYADDSKQKLLYLNPPRTGVEYCVLNWIINDFVPHKIAYLSCSAGTLKRDLEFITDAGYEVLKIVPFDFFPHTIHVESLVLLHKKIDIKAIAS